MLDDRNTATAVFTIKSNTLKIFVKCQSLEVSFSRCLMGQKHVNRDSSLTKRALLKGHEVSASVAHWWLWEPSLNSTLWTIVYVLRSEK